MDRIERALERLRAVAAEIPRFEAGYPLEAPLLLEPADEAEVRSVEVEVGELLPEEYRMFLARCGGISAMDVWNGYALHSCPDMRRILRNDSMRERIGGERLLPIGSDGGGNGFMLAVPSGDVWKWRYDHFTEPFEKLTASFSEFLERMADDWEHFARSDGQWNYMSG
jgi:hypothetical protein